MKTVKVRNVVLGEGKPKIIIPLVDATRASLADSARRVLAYPCDLVEWRADYYNTYSSREWGVASNYHLCIDVSSLGIDKTVDFIEKFVRERNGL